LVAGEAFIFKKAAFLQAAFLCPAFTRKRWPLYLVPRRSTQLKARIKLGLQNA